MYRKKKFHIIHKFDEKHCKNFLKGKMKCLEQPCLNEQISNKNQNET